MTLKALYQQHTGDTTTHQRTIGARLARIPDRRRRKVVELRVAGKSLREIAAEYAISHGSAQSIIKSTMERIRKEIAHEPRYNRVGRRRRQQPQTTRAAEHEATPPVQTRNILRQIQEHGTYTV